MPVNWLDHVPVRVVPMCIVPVTCLAASYPAPELQNHAQQAQAVFPHSSEHLLRILIKVRKKCSFMGVFTWFQPCKNSHKKEHFWTFIRILRRFWRVALAGSKMSIFRLHCQRGQRTQLRKSTKSHNFIIIEEQYNSSSKTLIKTAV